MRYTRSRTGERMGKAISYCYKCSSLLREDDFAHGKAVHVGDRVACAGCAPEAQKAPPRHESSKKLPAVRVAPSPPSTRRVAGKASPRNKPLILGGAAVAGLLVLIIAVASSKSGKEKPPEPAKPLPVVSPPPRKPPERAADSPGADRAALEAARTWAREHPDDPTGQLREYQKVALEWEKTPSGAEARKEVGRLKAEIQARVSTALAALEKEIRAPIDRKDYAEALAILDRAKARVAAPEWELALGKRIREVREMREAAPPAGPGGLIGHWTFDEGTGTTAADTSGKGHQGKLVGNVTWTDGKFGKAVRFDGSGGHVLLPNSPPLDKVQAETYTLSAWFMPEVTPPRQEGVEAIFGIVMKSGFHAGLCYFWEHKFEMEHWLAGDVHAVSGTWSDAYPPGAWYHVAGTLDRPAGTTQTWVNGRLKDTRKWAPGTATREYGAMPWRIGVGDPKSRRYHYAAQGVIDDVRIYDRALTADEIRGLFEGGR